MTTVEPLAPGTAQALATSNTSDGGDSDSLVPALAVLTALLAGLAALRWIQTRRNA